MDNIRISINASKLAGARVIKTSNPQTGLKELYLAIPVSSLYVPAGDNPCAFIMANAIPSPNSLYGDFLIKPYISGEDFTHMSDEERRAIPIIGKGTFVKPKASKEMQAAAEVVDDVEAAGLVPTQQKAPMMPPPAQPQPAITAKEYFTAKSLDGQQYQETFSNWEDVATFCSFNTLQWPIIEAWTQGRLTARYRWDEASLQWRVANL